MSGARRHTLHCKVHGRKSSTVAKGEIRGYRHKAIEGSTARSMGKGEAANDTRNVCSFVFGNVGDSDGLNGLEYYLAHSCEAS